MKNDKIGLKFNRLEIIEVCGPEYFPGGQRKTTQVICKCDCGNTKKVALADLKRESVVSCGCYKQSEIYKEKHRINAIRLNSSKYLDKNNKIDKYSPFRALLKNCKNIGRKKCEICLEDIKKQWEKQNGICIYSGVSLILPLFNDIKTPAFLTASIDRIDSSKNYTKDNIQIISITCNFAKNKLSHDEMKQFIDIIRFGEDIFL